MSSFSNGDQTPGPGFNQGFPGGGDGSGLGRASHNLVSSILVTLFCCQPFGIVAIVYSALTMGHNDAGRYQQAHKTAKTAMMWNYIGLGVALAFILGYVLLVVVLGGLGAAGTTP